MLKTITLSTFAIGACLILITNLGHTNSGGPPNGTTGAPGEGNCSRCHGAAIDGKDNFQISLLGGVSSFAPGQRVQLQLQHLATSPRYGFALTAFDNANQGFGSLEVTDALNTQLSTAANRKQYLKHTSSGIRVQTWQMAWTAPAASADTSSVTFYAAGMQANGINGSDQGDKVFLTNLRLPRLLTAVSEQIVTSASLRLFPNPCTESVHVQLEATKAAPVIARLYNTAGILQDEQTFFAKGGEQTLSWKFIKKPAAGTYIVRLEAGGYTTAQRLQIQ